MKLSCLPVSLFQSIVDGTMPVADWLAFAREIGLDGTECSLGFIQPIGRLTGAKMRQLADEAGIAISMVTCHPDFTNPDPAERARQIDDMTANLQLAAQLGAPLARVLSGQRHPGVSDQQGVTWAIEGLRTLCAIGDQMGVQLAIENHTKSFFWTYFDFAQRADILFQIVDGLRDTSLGVNFDTANPLVAGDDPIAIFEHVADRLAILHVADLAVPGQFAFCRIGTGVAPIADVFRRARARGFDGWVSIEEASRTGLDGFRVAVDYVRATWDAAAP